MRFYPQPGTVDPKARKASGTSQCPSLSQSGGSAWDTFRAFGFYPTSAIPSIPHDTPCFDMGYRSTLGIGQAALQQALPVGAREDAGNVFSVQPTHARVGRLGTS